MVAAMLLLAAGSPRVAAQSSDQAAVINREYAIKAAFLYHFSSYVEWPANVFPAEGEPFVIGIYQTDPFGSALDKIAATKTVAGRPIVVQVVKSPVDLIRCHILFVPMSVSTEQQDIVLQRARDALLLVVGESDDFVQRGGDVQFFIEGNKVRFAFSAEFTKGSELKVSSKLLSLAKIIPGS
jgi:hypothetical protein